MKIYSLQITDTTTGVSPVYEVHTWDKVEEIIKATKELMGEMPFTWEVYGSSK
jgi:hypothetical protein